MDEYRHDLDAETAERLLGGVSPTHDAGAERLARLLAAAGGPPRPREYAREEEALMAFRAAASTARRRLSWRSLLTFKVFAATATITVGGLAFASTTGIIPSPFDQDQMVSPTTGTTSGTPDRSRLGSPGAVPSALPSEATAAAISGLCHAYLAKDPAARGKALETPAFADLVTAAGGADKVDAYCAALPEKEKEDKSRAPRPTHEPNSPPSPPAPEEQKAPSTPNPPRASRR